MRELTKNMKDIVGIDEIEWLAGSRWALPMVKEAHPYFPHVLFVDEDTRLAKNIAKLARRNRIHLVTCKSAWDLRHLDRETPFDVAILDFDSGELARKQVGHFLEDHVPVLIVGQSESSKALEENFPNVIHKVVDKNAGPRAILEEALALVGARHLLEEPTASETSMGYKIFRANQLPDSLWLFVLATLIALTLLWRMTQAPKTPSVTTNQARPLVTSPQRKESAAQTSAPISQTKSEHGSTGSKHQPQKFRPIPKAPKNIYRWDQAPVAPHMQSG